MLSTRSARKSAAVSAERARPSQVVEVPPDQREHMIAEAAYFRALQRGFQGGDPVTDWLAAEQEIDRATPAR